MHLLETSKVFAMELPTCPEYGIDIDDFYHAVKRYGVKAFLTQPNYGNPLGHSYPEEIKKEIVEICSRFNVPIIEDDINGDFAFNGKRGSNMKKVRQRRECYTRIIFLQDSFVRDKDRLDRAGQIL